VFRKALDGRRNGMYEERTIKPRLLTVKFAHPPIRAEGAMPLPTSETKPDDDYEIIFRKSITLRDGRVIHASEYNLKAFPIRVPKGAE